jgi:hypothetical protein
MYVGTPQIYGFVGGELVIGPLGIVSRCSLPLDSTPKLALKRNRN